jgi:SAM-dependent methyltransferase
MTADTSTTNYTGDFYDRLRDGVERSARAMVPLVLELTGARTVVDVGCGSGHWLKHFKLNGIEQVLGIDGVWVTSHELANGEFQSADLTQPFRSDRTFDLAVSLEVAEHLPPGSAAAFVASLVQLAPVVMFSAAIPEQGGVDHLNEQWQDYWAGLFEHHGFVPVDAIRPRVWSNPTVESWYAQNTVLYVDRRYLDRYPRLADAARQTSADRLPVVHPRHYRARLIAADSVYGKPDPNRFALSTLLEILPTVFRNALTRRTGGGR